MFMAWLLNLDLIHFFDFYLAVIFLLSTVRRIGQYRAVAGLALAAPGRWPKLFQLIKQHRTILLTWQFALPSLLAFMLMIVQLSASRYIWHQASLTVDTVMNRPIAWPVLALVGLAMLAVDVYCTAVAGEVNRKETEKYFDDAEHWLRSWKAPVVHFFTLGRINPRQMVAAEVQKALLEASALINSSMWWVTAQVGLRIAFGLALWVTYAVVLA
jgi:hypothetical protein